MDPRQVLQAKRLKWATAGLLTLGAFWAYWPTLVELVHTWERQPDYSHGFLVAPLAVYFLWIKRDSRPPISPHLAWPGIVLLGLGVAMRIAGACFYIDSVDGWSIVPWLAGMVWLLGGGRLLIWAAPSIAFLWFMVPLPFRAEGLVSYPLQRVATKLSCWMLQFLGLPALAEGNTIFVGDQQLSVEEACSGLRIFMAIIALACAYLIVMRRSWWEKVLVFAGIVPIALIVNALRIVGTGLLLQMVSSEAAAKFSHDLAGWLMIPLAAALFGLLIWYLGVLFPTVRRADYRSMLQENASSQRTEKGRP